MLHYTTVIYCTGIHIVHYYTVLLLVPVSMSRNVVFVVVMLMSAYIIHIMHYSSMY